jgi:allophanate hydrolase subunit 2
MPEPMTTASHALSMMTSAANQSRAGVGGVDGRQLRSNDSPSSASNANDASQCVPT